MDHNNYHMYGGWSAMISIAGVVFNKIIGQGGPEFLKGMAAIISVLAGVMAIIYYCYAIKEKRQNLKK